MRAPGSPARAWASAEHLRVSPDTPMMNMEPHVLPGGDLPYVHPPTTPTAAHPALAEPGILSAALDAALEVSRDGLMIVDEGGAVTAVNAAFSDVWGIDATAEDRDESGGPDGEAVLHAAIARAVDGEAVRTRIRGGNDGAWTITLDDGRVLACRGASLIHHDRRRGTFWSFHQIDAGGSGAGSHHLSLDPLTGAVSTDLLPAAGAALIRRARGDAEALSIVLIDLVNLIPIARAHGPEIHNEMLSACAGRWDGLRAATISSADWASIGSWCSCPAPVRRWLRPWPAGSARPPRRSPPTVVSSGSGPRS